jgi:hypothetical protein
VASYAAPFGARLPQGGTCPADDDGVAAAQHVGAHPHDAPSPGQQLGMPVVGQLLAVNEDSGGGLAVAAVHVRGQLRVDPLLPVQRCRGQADIPRE